MERQDDEMFERLERVLAEAHRLRSEPALEAELVHAVMRDVRGSSPIRNGTFERSVWQVAMMAAGLAAVFTVTALWYAGTENGAAATMVAEEFDDVSGFGE